jgi:hypothetical protein
MGWISSKKTAAADATTVALHHIGKKVAGEKGVKAAKAVSAATLGQYLEPCSSACGHCNTPHANS